MLRSIVYRAGEMRRRADYALEGMRAFRRLRTRDSGTSIAAVIVGRNDDYMVDFSYRLRATTEWNLKFLVDEVIFVEWNPPDDRELLSPFLTRMFPSVRAFVVPKSIHCDVSKGASIPLLEYHAKNVGIRRAETKWVIATNADVAFAADTIVALRKWKYFTDQALTAERVDIPWRELRQEPIGFVDCLRYRRIIPYEPVGTGDFLMASRELWNAVRGYDEALTKHRIGCDLRGAAQMRAHGAQLVRAGRVLHLAHPTSCTEGSTLHHGERATVDGVPYQNAADWGLAGCRENEIAERVWELS